MKILEWNESPETNKQINFQLYGWKNTTKLNHKSPQKSSRSMNLPVLSKVEILDQCF